MSARSNTFRWAVISLMLVITCSRAFAGKTLYVDDDGPADFNNIQAAIDDANDGDTVIISTGTYTGDGNRDIRFKGKAITVRSTDPNDTNIVAGTIIDCNGTKLDPHRGFYFYGSRDSDAVVMGLTITNGYHHEGGAICCDEYSSPKILFSRIVNSSSNRGGGIYIGNGSITIIDGCTIANNTAFNPNYRGEGAGIFCSVNFQNPVISNCIVVNNRTLASVTPDNGIGGGIYSVAEHATISNCTVVGNSAASCSGIGINEYRTATVSNCIIWDNSNEQLSPNAKVSYSNVQGGFLGVGNLNADPLFVNPDNNDFHLLPSSPCIDAGDPEFVPNIGETDRDLEPRVMGLRVDIGADEFLSTPTPVIGISPKLFVFNADEGRSNPNVQSLFVFSAGTANLTWELSENSPWLQAYPISGESPGDSDEVSLSVDISGLAPGKYTCEVIITAFGAPNSPQEISVALYIRPTTGILNVPSQYKTIQSAINSAHNGDIVILSPGIYNGLENRDLDFKGKAITVRSSDPKDPAVVARTIIDCEARGRGFNFHSNEGPDSVLAGLTITNGAAKDGCGIYIINSNPTISYCTVANNSSNEDSSDGGGIFIKNADPIITYCTLSDNSVKSSGGGIFCYNSSPTITYCTITGNRARDEGGGISCNYFSRLVISHCTIRNNVVSFRRGGGIACRGSNIIVTKCTIADNSANDSGGGLWLSATDAMISQCTITGNSTYDRWGGGIYFELGSTTITDCILWNNAAPNGSEIGVYSWQGYFNGTPNPEPSYNSYLTISHSNVRGDQPDVYVYGEPGWFLLNWEASNIDAEPLFADPNNGDYHLRSQAGRWDPNNQTWANDDVTSPCIDAGDMSSPIGFEPFPNGGIINMGAYGGTEEASKSYFDAPVCETIIAGDINGDCKVNFKDFAILASHWLADENR